MKRSLIAVVVASTMVLSGCIGSFTLTNKVYKWNESATGDKYVNTAIMWVLGFFTPVYGGTLLIDVAILNVIEFWTGKNPVAFKGQETLEKVVTTENGTSKVAMGNNEIIITRINGIDAGKALTLRYDPAESSFYMSDGQNGPAVKVGSISGTTVSLYSPDGRVIKRSLSQMDADQAVLR
jgi:hypothetical protein